MDLRKLVTYVLCGFLVGALLWETSDAGLMKRLKKMRRRRKQRQQQGWGMGGGGQVTRGLIVIKPVQAPGFAGGGSSGGWPQMNNFGWDSMDWNAMRFKRGSPEMLKEMNIVANIVRSGS